MLAVQRCRGFYRSVGTVCRCITKHNLIKTTMSCIPVMRRRTFCGTRQLRRKDATVRRTPLPSPCFLSDRQWAHDVIEASALRKSSNGHKVVIFHVNPGCSVLTESLLQLCDYKQIAWEPRRLYTDYLNSLTESYKTKFAYCRKSFLGDNQMKILDEVLLNDITTDDATWHAKIIGNVPEMYSLIQKLVRVWSGSFTLRLCQFSVVETILIVTGSEYRLLTEAEHFWHSFNYAKTAIYELFLRTQLLKTVPLSAFNYTRYLLKSTRFDYDRENLYIVRLSLRTDLDLICSGEDVIDMMMFLKTISRMKRHRVIPAMEHLCPDIGITLLERGISMMDRISDIPLNMWPGIYHAIKTSSNFSSSPLYNILQRI